MVHGKFLLHVIVRRFAGNDDIVNVALSQARVRDADEAGFCLEIRDRLTAKIAHSGAKAADQLVHHGFEGSAVGHAAFNSFGTNFESRLPELLSRAVNDGRSPLAASVISSLL